MTEQWSRFARNWAELGSPLQPAPEDVGFYQHAIADWCALHPGRAPRGLILGVTPELYRLAWPEPDLLWAVDRTVELIDRVWPGRRDRVLHSDWRDLDLPPASVDIALCDGGLHLLDYPNGQRRLAERLVELLPPGGRLVIRLFTPPEIAELPEQVLAALHAGHIRDLNCLKLRLAAALMESPERGVCTHDIWSCVKQQAGAGWRDLAERLGWTEKHLAVIEAYRDSTARYYLVTVRQAIDLFSTANGGAFEVGRVSFPGYAMGELCPTIQLTRS